MHLVHGRAHYGPADRATLVGYVDDYEGGGQIVRKRARAVAVRLDFPFAVETDHGVMEGEAGDYLVTNHPDDDPTSDIWPVSAARFAATYEPV